MHKKISYGVVAVALSGAALGLSGPVAWAQKPEDIPDSAPWNKASVQKISIALAQPSTSEYLLAIARAADANLLADATDFAPQSPPLSGQWQHFSTNSDGKQWSGPMYHLLLTLGYERSLTLRQFPTRTFLMWSEPEMAALGRAAAAALPQLQIERVGGGDAWNGFPDSPLRRAVASYFVDTLHWDGRTPLEVPLDQLPAKLQLPIRALYLRPESILPNTAETLEWYRDDFWKTTVLHIPSAGEGRQPDITKIQITGITERTERKGSTSSRLMYFPRVSSVRSQTRGGPIAMTPEQEPARNSLAEPEAAATPQAVPEVPVAAPLALEQEPALQGEIALEASRRPLREVVALAKQQGVPVTVDEAVEDRLLTVHVSRMPRWQWMQRLSDLLGVRWEKDGDNAYAMRPPLTLLDAQALRIGDSNWFHYWQDRAEFPDKSVVPPQLQFPGVPDEIQNIAQELDVARLAQRPRARDREEAFVRGQFSFGVPVSELQPEQIAALRRHVERATAFGLADAYLRLRRFNPAAARSVTLKLLPPTPPETVRVQGKLLQTSGGGPRLSLSVPGQSNFATLPFSSRDFAPARQAALQNQPGQME